MDFNQSMHVVITHVCVTGLRKAPYNTHAVCDEIRKFYTIS